MWSKTQCTNQAFRHLQQAFHTDQLAVLQMEIRLCVQQTWGKNSIPERYFQTFDEHHSAVVKMNKLNSFSFQHTIITLLVHYPFLYIIMHLTYWDSACSIAEENIRSFSLNECASCCQQGNAGGKTFVRRSLPVLNWGQKLTQVDQYSGHKSCYCCVISTKHSLNALMIMNIKQKNIFHLNSPV